MGDKIRQTITSSTFVLLVVGVVWYANGRHPTSTPVEPKLGGGIGLKIGRINHFGGLEAGKVSNLQPFEGRLGDG